MVKYYNVDCPFTGDFLEIVVEYTEVKSTGTLQSSYRKIDFHCPNQNVCDQLNGYGFCSAYANLPVIIHD